MEKIKNTMESFLEHIETVGHVVYSARLNSIFYKTDLWYEKTEDGEVKIYREEDLPSEIKELIQ